jgi:hypothetical protein
MGLFFYLGREFCVFYINYEEKEACTVDRNLSIQHFMQRPVWAQIDLDAAAFNIRQIRRMVGPDVAIMSVVKANAYGHGSVELARVFLEHGADRVAVACLGEAIELRQGGITGRIVILGHTDGSQAAELVNYGIDVTVFRYEDALAFSQAAVAQQRMVHVHIAVDTGMGRIGYRPDAASIAEIQQIAMLPHVQLDSVFTHFAVSDESDVASIEYTKLQYKRLQAFLDELRQVDIVPAYVHCCNSAGVVWGKSLLAGMVRPGILQYGYHPSATVQAISFCPRPVMSLRACITHIKVLEAGETVSYGRHFQAKEQRVIATLPIGYADGYPRALSNRGDVLVRGKRARQVGNICMDQCMIDVTDIPQVAVGDEVVLFGQQGDESVPLEELACCIGTIAHEILCNINRRVPRVYVQGGEVVRRLEYLVE